VTDSFAIGLLAGAGTLVHVLVQIVFVVVALTVVRRRRSDAALLLAGGAGLALVTMITSWLSYAVVPRFMVSVSTGGASWMGAVFGLLSFGASIMHALAQIMVIAAVVRLAKPERTVADDPGRYE
jgi:hypothetical protein